MSEDELLKIYRKWLDEGTIMTDWGLMEFIGKNYVLIKKPRIKKSRYGTK